MLPPREAERERNRKEKDDESLLFLRLDLLYGGPGRDVFDVSFFCKHPDPDIVLRVLLQAGEGTGGFAGFHRLCLQNLRKRLIRADLDLDHLRLLPVLLTELLPGSLDLLL